MIVILMHTFLFCNQMLITMNPSIGGYVGNSTERAIGPGQVKFKSCPISPQIAVKFHLGHALHSKFRFQIIIKQNYVILVLQVTAIFIAESVRTHKGVSSMLSLSNNSFFGFQSVIRRSRSDVSHSVSLR